MYGTGTRSYNRSSEARQMKQEIADFNKKLEAGEIKFAAYEIGPFCECSAFPYPHEPIRHEKCLSRTETKELQEWLKAGNSKLGWIGWAQLGTTIRYRRAF